MPVVGTAGHVDHGKSTLVQALTGRDPDRWDEEKRRGLTIDLGFAWTTLPSGIAAGFVDVPGHERFIKNMLAGIDAISVALFVVAADEGWMPQSEEHLEVLDLLGIDRGVIALTRADLVDEDTLELAILDVDDRLVGTTLEGSPVIPTAATEGRGIDQIKNALDSALSEWTASDTGRPRLWVDRSFTISGVGTVVTGTLVDGPVAVDDVLALFPGGTTGRVRSVQSHERSLDRVDPGNRAALNIVGIERESVERGAMFGREGDWITTRRFTADLSTVRGLGDPVRERGSFHLHLGSGAWPARLRLLESKTLEHRGAALVEVDAPLPVKVGDRFILREVGRRAIVAGGRVLDPAPPRRARHIIPSLPSLRAARIPDEAAAALLAVRGSALLSDLSAQTGGGSPRASLIANDRAFSHDHVVQLRSRAVAETERYHRDNPLRPGIPKASLAGRLGVTVADLEALVGTSEELETVAADVRVVGFGVDLDEASRSAWEEARTALESGGLGPPRRKELALDDEVIHALIRSGDLVEVSETLLYLPKTLTEIRRRAESLPDGFTVADFRDALGITRKHAVPLLEWLDAEGVTIRDGDSRRVRRGQQPAGQ